MKMSLKRVKSITAGGLLLAGSVLVADGIRFSDFTPLATSTGPIADETMPIVLGNPLFEQRSIADRFAQLADGKPNGTGDANDPDVDDKADYYGDWDMNTVNETGPHKGRYLFTVFETDRSGVQRHDLLTGQTDTIWYSPEESAHVSFDPSFWTPWGTLITGEESWCTAGPGCVSPYGRLFELKNPTHAPAITLPLNVNSNDGADFVHRNVIPRTSHEGIQFDKAGSMYFIDELNGGNIYKFTSGASWGDIRSGKAEYFDAGQTFVLRVGDGSAANATGAYAWVPFTDAYGNALPGALTIMDPNGVTSVDARNTTNLQAFKGTDYQRPEDLQIQTVKGREYLYIAMTTTDNVYRLDLRNQMIAVFASQGTVNLASAAGAAVGSAFDSPDNLAIDHEGNIYIIEDRPGGGDNDIWFARDLNQDGDLTDPGEGLGRWATNGAVGSEFSGLYFDPTDKRRAWVNIQHPDSQNDRTIEITVPKH